MRAHSRAYRRRERHEHLFAVVGRLDGIERLFRVLIPTQAHAQLRVRRRQHLDFLIHLLPNRRQLRKRQRHDVNAARDTRRSSSRRHDVAAIDRSQRRGARQIERKEQTLGWNQRRIPALEYVPTWRRINRSMQTRHEQLLGYGAIKEAF